MIKKILYVLAVTASVATAQTPTPILNSHPTVTDKVLYLDFDGQKVSGTNWNNGNTINAMPSTLSTAKKIEIFNRISEDYRPFDLNITTDSVRFNNAQPNKRMRIVITPTSSWYGNSAGGVAYVNSFTWGGTPGTPCWVFENMLGYSAKNIGEAAAHEAGHTFSLRHQSIYNAQCVKTDEYHDGWGTGVTGWAPIMGVGYSKNVTIWHTGQSAVSCTTIQRDHDNGSTGITGPGRLNYRADDVGNTSVTSKHLNITSTLTRDSGLITTPSDIDAYSFEVCNTSGFTFNMKPWALDTGTYGGANLDIRFHLYNSSTNSLVALDTNLNRLFTLVTVTLNPGNYYFTIDGGRSNNYPDYGSLGKYYMNIKAAIPPPVSSTIQLPANICAGQSFTLNSNSTNNPTSWSWMVSDASSSNNYTLQAPPVSLAAGQYTISLLASNSSTLNACPVTVTLNVGTPPNITVSGNNAILCPPLSTTLTASGAQSYTWLPGNSVGVSQIVSPTVTTNYTVSAANGSCRNQAVTTVTVNPPFTLGATLSSSILCIGDTVTITGTGATSYTFQPGNITVNPAVVSPSNTVGYSVIGKSGACTKTIVKTVNVSPPVYFYVTATDSSLCSGQTATITASGVQNYTFQPGNVVTNQLVVSPTVNTTYTIVGENTFNCDAEKTLAITAEPCDYTGLTSYGLQKHELYPNPVNDLLTIEGGSAKNIVVTDVQGRVIYTVAEAQSHTEIATGSWPSGLYFVRIESDRGVEVHKLIKE